jgi:hypothetical protein
MSSTTTPLDVLAALRERYTAMLSEGEHQIHHAKEQLIHLNALLLDQMLPVGAVLEPLPVKAALAPAPMPAEEITVVESSGPVAAPKRVSAAAKKAAKNGKQQPFLRETALPLLRPYVGLTKTDAVAKVMEDHTGQIIYLDDVIKILHGDLDPVTLRQERARMRNLMWRGADRGLWDKVKGQESAYTFKSALLTPDSKVKGKSGRAARLKVAPAPLPVEAKPVATKAAKAPKAAKAAPKAAAKATPKASKAVAAKAPKATPKASKAVTAKAPKAAPKATTKAVASKAAPAKAKPGRPGKKAAVAPMAATGASLMGSVEKVLQANKGKPMTADEIATSLFGEMDRNKLAEVKKQISDRLAKGVKYKRWQRVANKIGVYMFA